MKLLCDEVPLSTEAQAALEGLIENDPPTAPLMTPAGELGKLGLAVSNGLGGVEATDKGRRWLKHFRLKQKYPSGMIPPAEWC